MKERKFVCKFTLDTEIYDPELPQKIVSVLQNETLEVKPNLYYGIDLIFDKLAYQTPEFFQYPLEKLLPAHPSRRDKMTEQEQWRHRTTSILSQQLSCTLSAVKTSGFDLSNGAIIGDNINDLHKVFIELYEAREKEYDKKGRLKANMIVHNIMPDRPYTLVTAANAIARMIAEKAMEEKKRELELAAHTPNMIPAGELFTSVAKAILLDKRRKAEGEINTLAEHLRLHATIQSDWPLEIVFTERPEQPLSEDFEIDCPEFLLYHENTNGAWTLNKIKDLVAAKFQITQNGYNRKTTADMAVLHNLKPMGFTLFAETEEGMVKVKKQEAQKMKKLTLSWKKYSILNNQ